MSDKKLRIYQKKVVNVLTKMEEKGDFSTIIELPTGAGKTFTISEYLKSQALKRGSKVLWLTHRDFLLSQAENEFGSYKTIKVSSKCEDISSITLDTDIVFCSIFSINFERDAQNNIDNFIAWIREAQKEDKKLFIIVDEAHHVGADTYNDFFE